MAGRGGEPGSWGLRLPLDCPRFWVIYQPRWLIHPAWEGSALRELWAVAVDPAITPQKAQGRHVLLRPSLEAPSAWGIGAFVGLDFLEVLWGDRGVPPAGGPVPLRGNARKFFASCPGRFGVGRRG